MPVSYLKFFVATCFFLVGLLISACDEKQPERAALVHPEVDVSHPIIATIDIWDEYTGRFGAIESVEIRARVSGYIEKTAFQDGQPVKAGDVLFVIDQRPFNIAMQSARADLQLQKKERDRGLELRRNNSISQEEVDKREVEYQLAKATYEQAKLNLEFTEVKSPINGIVSRDLVTRGNLITGGTASATLLTTVVSVDPIHFYFDAGERDLLRYLRLDQSHKRESSRSYPNEVQARLQDEREFLHNGVMDFVDNQVDQSTGTIQGRAIFDNKDGFILPGIFGRIRLIEEKGVQAMLLPDAIIGTDQSKKFVMVIDEQNKASRKFVTLGKLHTQELRIIESGLMANDKVIVNGLMRARPGATVSPVEVNIRQQFNF